MRTTRPVLRKLALGFALFSLTGTSAGDGFFSCSSDDGNVDATVVGNEGSGTVVGVQVLVSPAEIHVGPESTRQFSARVFGTSEQVVVWALRSPNDLDSDSTPAGAGEISASGLYYAPETPSGPWAIVATSVAEPRARDVALVTVGWPVVNVTTPSTGIADLSVGDELQLNAAVHDSEGPTSDSIIWSIVEGDLVGGSISSTGPNTGLYKTPGHPGTFHIRATNGSNARISSLVRVVVQDEQPITLTVAPRKAALAETEGVRLAAKVTNALFDSVSWSVYEDEVPSFDAIVDPFLNLFSAPEIGTPVEYTV